MVLLSIKMTFECLYCFCKFPDGAVQRGGGCEIHPECDCNLLPFDGGLGLDFVAGSGSGASESGSDDSGSAD